MSSTTWIPDCKEKCKSVEHGDIITAAISKRSIKDEDLCAYLNYICTCCELVKDSAGRTALHVAASCGRIKLVRWLVQKRHANINAKDEESGYTALHRAMFYGKINVAVELIKLGANISLQDCNSLTMLEHAMKDGTKHPTGVFSGELYVWGANTNNLLGPQQARKIPELLDVFHKEFPDESVKQICIDKFHSVIVTTSGKIFSCGHGQGGRLGLGVQHTVVTPTAINLHDNQGETITCIQASISTDHSMFLGSDGNIYSCGLNMNRVLGLTPPPEQLLVPKQLKHLSLEIEGVCTGRFHTVAWGSKGLYTWGLNGGQLGHPMNNSSEDKYINTPRLVKILNIAGTSIKTVAASDGATAICTDKGDVYVLHEYQCRKIASRQLNIVQISIIGGKLNSALNKDLSNESNKELKVVALTNTGNVLLWQESDPQLCRCIFSINRAIEIRQVAINANELLFVTVDGEAFQGFIRPRKKKACVGGSNIEKEKTIEKSAFHKFLEKEDCIYVKVSKFTRLHRAISISSDPKGRDYCVIQAHPYRCEECFDIDRSEMEDDLKSLLEDVEESDYIHDTALKINKKCFPIHKYIISMQSSYLANLFSESSELLEFNCINLDIFKQFLKFIYTGTCDLLVCGELQPENLRQLCDTNKDEKNSGDNDNISKGDISAFEYYNKHKSNKSAMQKHEKNKTKNPVRMLHEVAKKFGCTDLQNALSNLEMEKFFIWHKSKKDYKLKPLRFNRKSFPELYDVEVKCSDGNSLMAHKCILVARLEYFNNMFSVRWGLSQTAEISLPFPSTIVEELLDFLYTDSISNINGKDVDHFFKLLILADQLFAMRLKSICEFYLSQLLTIKNAIHIVSLAHMYNAEKLKIYCISFIIANITSFIELRSFDDMDESLLEELTNSYCSEIPVICCRVITPYSTAASDETIMSVSSLYPVSIDEEIEKVSVKPVQKRRSRTHKNSASEKNTSFDLDISSDNIIQFPDIPEAINSQKNNSVSGISSRLRAITVAQEKVKLDKCETLYMKLGSNDNSTVSFEGFPELNSPPNVESLCSKSPHKFESRHKIVKISQKQRKRLSSENNNSQSPPASESPKNPWKIIPSVTSLSGSVESPETNIGEIISHERKQKENFVKMRSKLLIHTQIEDKAIDELHKFYNTENISDEMISVERVSIGEVAVPIWVARNK